MKKSILNLGKALNKSEQKSINGGFPFIVCCDPLMTCCAPNRDPNSTCSFEPSTYPRCA